jgi:hypothetical protein
MTWAQDAGEDREGGPLFARQWVIAMEDSIAEVEKAMETLGKGSPWSPDTKVSDDFLAPLFGKFFAKLGLPNLMQKTDYHVLAQFVPKERLSPDVIDMLDRIVEVKSRAKSEDEPEGN